MQLIMALGPIDNKSASVQAMAGRTTGDSPLPEPMMIKFSDAIQIVSLGNSGNQDANRRYLNMIQMCQLGFATWIYEKQYDQFDNLRENSDLAHENITLIDEAGIYNHQSDSCVTGVPATVSNNSYKLIGDVVMHIFIKALGRHCFRWWLVYWKKNRNNPSHSLNQCWLINTEALWCSRYGNLPSIFKNINHKYIFENNTFETPLSYIWGQWVII